MPWWGLLQVAEGPGLLQAAWEGLGREEKDAEGGGGAAAAVAVAVGSGVGVTVAVHTDNAHSDHGQGHLPWVNH